MNAQVARNVGIVLALSAVVYVLRRESGGEADLVAAVLLWMLNVVFWGTLLWFAMVMYRQYRGELHSLGDGARFALYASVGLIALTLTATAVLWNTGPGTLAWFALLVAGGYGIFASWRSYQRY